MTAGSSSRGRAPLPLGKNWMPERGTASALDTCSCSHYCKVVTKYLSSLMGQRGGDKELLEYVYWLMKRSECCKNCVTYACCLLRRMPQTERDTINPHNIRRLFLTALMLSHDFLYDEFYSIESWKIIASNLFCADELINLKNAMLHILEFNVLVSSREFGATWGTLVDMDTRMAEERALRGREGRARLNREESFNYRSPLNLCRNSLVETEAVFRHAGFLGTVLRPPQRGEAEASATESATDPTADLGADLAAAETAETVEGR